MDTPKCDIQNIIYMLFKISITLMELYIIKIKMIIYPNLSIINFFEFFKNVIL